MKPRIRLSDDTKREILRRYRAGEKPKALSAEFGFGRNTIHIWANDPHYNGPATGASQKTATSFVRPAGSSSYSKEFRDATAARFLAGEPAVALGKELGVKHTLIYGWGQTLRKGTRAKTKPGQPLALPTPPVVLAPLLNGADYCPCCGFPIAMVNKTVNAIKAQATR